MRNHRQAALSLVVILAAALAASAQGPVVPSLIHYQGRLVNGTNLVNGKTSISFRLFDAPTGGAFPACVDSNDVPVVDGLYSTYIGDNITWGSLDVALMQTQVWIEVVIGTNTMSPREQVVSVGYARYAASLPANAVQTHMIGSDQIYGFHIQNGEIANADLASGAVSSNKINWAAMPAGLQDGDDVANYVAGAGLEIVGSTISISNGGIGTAQLAAGAVSSNKIEWGSMPAGLQDGDDGYSPLGYDENGTFSPAPVAGGTDSIAMGRGASALANYSVVGGGRDNVIPVNADYSAVGGGSANRIGDLANYATVAGGNDNRIEDSGSWATIGGGGLNRLRNNAWYSTIGGGYQNEINTNAQSATVAGGNNNRIAAEARNAVIAGGLQNKIYPSATNAAIGGGSGNVISNSASYAAIGGGGGNRIGTNGVYATVGGGWDNHVNARARFGVIGGGSLNTVGADAEAGTIGGGSGNAIDNGATYAAIGGGQGNQVGENCGSAVIAGGSSHSIGDQSSGAAIGGGNFNTTGTNCGMAVIGGGQQNNLGNNCHYSMIGGGDHHDVSAGADHAVVGGGEDNDLGKESRYAVVAGGMNNDIASEALYSSIGGGWNNKIESGARLSMVGGGEANSIRSNALRSVIAGGDNNVIGTNAGASVIGGGYQNQIGKDAQAATIPGGYLCKVSADANGAFAAGTHAVAAHQGSFVLTDSQMSDHTSTGPDTLNTRFQGGIHLNGGTNKVIINNIGIQACGPCFGTFPRPSYDSGWQTISMGGTLTLTHSLGGETNNYIIDLQFKDNTYGHGINQGGYGMYLDPADRMRGAYWSNLTTSDLKVHRADLDMYADQIRVRIWVYQ